MFNFGFAELMIILILALIIFGPGKLPQVGSALGKGISEFKKAARGLQEDLSDTTSAIQEPKKIEAPTKEDKGDKDDKGDKGDVEPQA